MEVGGVEVQEGEGRSRGNVGIGMPRIPPSPSLPVPTTRSTLFLRKPNTRKRSATKRIVCISDTHGCHAPYFAHLPPGDVLVHAGDFTKAGEVGSVKSLDQFFQDQSTRFSHIICIAGNHDVTFQPDYYGPPQNKWRRYHRQPFDPIQCRAALQHCTYLEDSGCTVPQADSSNLPLKFYASPWTIEFYDWAFNVPEDRINKMWERIPEPVDVLVTHGPPLGRCDRTSSGVNVGCPHLLRHVQHRIRPRLHVFGHIHEGHGTSFDGRTLYVNASNLDERYRPSNPCIVVDVPHDPAQTACVVEPCCTLDDLTAWLQGSPYHQLQAYANQLDESERMALPSRNDLVAQNAFEVVADVLRLHRDASAQAELRSALMHIHAESFGHPDDPQIS